MNNDYRFEDKNFEVGYWTNNSPWVNPGDFCYEDLMPQDLFCTKAPFGYSGQNLNITTNEDISKYSHRRDA